MHVIALGRARVSIESMEGDEAILATLGPGDVFGELVLLDGAPRSATAVAVEPTVTYTLAQPAFGPLIAKNEAFRSAILRNLALELRRLTAHASELHFLDLPGPAREPACAHGRGRCTRPARGGPPWPGLHPVRTRGDDRRHAPELNRVMTELVSEGLVRLEPHDLVVVRRSTMAERARW